MTSALRIVSTAVLALCASTAFAEDVPRLTGAVNYRNYPGVASMLFDRLEKPVVLDITVPLDNEKADGHLTTFVLDGQFELELHGQNGSRIHADTGFELVDESYYALNGAFAVRSGGVYSGVPHLQLEPVSLPGGATFVDVGADTFEPADVN